MEHFSLTKYLKLFASIEEYFQKQVSDEEKSKYNQSSIDLLKDINETGLLLQRIKDFEDNDIKQNEYIKNLEEDNKNKQEYINMLERRGFIRKLLRRGRKKLYLENYYLLVQDVDNFWEEFIINIFPNIQKNKKFIESGLN